MARVKGTILIDFVKVIRSDRKGSFDSFLNKKDRELIGQRLLPSAWYPYDTYKNCFKGVAAVIAKNNSQTVRQWGRLYGESILTGVYKGIVKESAPAETLGKYPTHIRNFFDFGEMQFIPSSPHEGVMAMRGFESDFEPQFHIMRGWLERTVELCGARDLKTDFSAKSWEGAPETRLQIGWKI